MADLLLRWLNHELELSTHVTHVEADFASGYLLGEILHRLNHQHDFADFMRSSSADAKILNFCLLEPTLRNLNIKFDANVAAAIMNEKKDAAANLLYQIKIAATRVGRAPTVSSKSLERTGVVPLHNRPVKLAKPSYDSENHRLFEHSVRRHVRSIASLQQEKDRIAEEATKRKAYLARMAEQKEILEATKAERLHRAYIHSSFIKEALEETDSPAWRLALQKKNAREQRRAAFFQQLMKKREEEEENITFSLRRKVQNDLDDFNSNGDSKSSTAGGRVSSRKSVGYGLRSLTTALGAASDRKKYSTSNLAGSSINERELYHANMLEMESARGVIKQQMLQREKRKEKLSRRRKRFVQECVYTNTRTGTARVASILENVVLRDTNSEKDVQGEMSRILTYKDVARENRSMRNQEYVNQQEMDTMSAIDRDTSCYHNLLLRFEDDSEMQVLERNSVHVSIEAADRFLNEQISTEIMKDMMEFVLFIAGKREETMHCRDPAIFLTAETWSEYKVKFANGHIPGNELPASTPDYSSHTELLDSHELENYLSSFRAFRTTFDQQPPLLTIDDGSLFLGATGPIEDCFVLGEGIKSLRWIARLVDTAPWKDDHIDVDSDPTLSLSGRLAPNSHHLLRILIFGPPFAGKGTQARLLGETHNLVVLSIHDLIQSSVESSSDVGQKVEELLTNGKEVPPGLYSRLVVESITELEAHTLATEGGSNKAGWLIFDLPATEQHSQHLEEQLTGYVDPAFVPSPSDFASAIAPGLNKPALSPTFLHGKSGVDLVFHIDCAVGTVLDRCLGKLEDCATGDKQHLVFDPPPDDSIVRHRLQHVNPSAFSSELLSLHCLANEEFSRDHKTWYTKFKTLHELSSRGMTVNEIHEAITAIVNQLQKDRQDETESQQLQMETMEQELMTSEEERQRRINSFEANIEEAKGGIAKVEASVAEAEEAKAKKEEILELRQKLEEAQHQLDSVVACVKSWVEEEQAQRPVPSSKYSGELVPETAHALAALWNNAETEYISTMKTSFSLLREQRHRATERAQLMTSEFCEFVRRPDQKQEIVNLFQKQFNDVVEEMRFDDLTKVELHARVDMLQDELGALIDTKIAANDEELSSMVGDGWTEDNCQQVAAIYQMALQAECDRFRISIQILVDGHSTASSERSQLSSIVETWQAHQSRLEMACRIYRDPANDTPVETPIALSTSAAAGKPPPKGKVKAPTPAAAAAPSTTAISEDAQAEVLSMPELLAEYTHVLQRCASWMDAITAIANAEEDDAANREHNGDYCKINLLNGIRYEHDLMQRRVRFLQEATEKSCDEITRSMRSIEITLRGVLEGRKDREQVAVADLVAYIRAAIEAEVAIPSFIDVSSEFIERFPTTVQLREDTAVRVDGDRRLLPRIPPEALPIVEEAHELRLNARQRDGLREALTSQTCDDSGLLPLCTLVEIIAALTSQPDALPEVWRRCPAHVIAQVAAGFTMKQSAFVDIEALLTAMSIRDDLLRQFQQDEAREELERQQQLELQHQQEEHERALFLQQQQDSQDSESAPAGTVE
ncbi:hypothetical protein PF002_g1938 [Phytophthora fragariae]|uniref:Calponin-homology (CH) domain-containing protein n=2 Tax=Phytophthora fragariae TaxID=53985 RepID=A0A6A4AEK3_9STRA|nr:hypothetical protein PF002_g1938 [Phytophthora fragariae]